MKQIPRVSQKKSRRTKEEAAQRRAKYSPTRNERHDYNENEALANPERVEGRELKKKKGSVKFKG